MSGPRTSERSRRSAVRRRARPRHRGRRGLRLLVIVLVTAAAGTAAVAALFLFAPPVPLPLEQRPPAAIAPPAAEELTPSTPPAPASSRSRGRTDWIFFFKPGDWLTRMADDAMLGVVVRVERRHQFADGTVGPVYVMQTMEGEERVLDADELERGARVR